MGGSVPSCVRAASAYSCRHGIEVWTAAELEQMSAQERHAIFDVSIVTDLDQVPPEFLAGSRPARTDHRQAESRPL